MPNYIQNIRQGDHASFEIVFKLYHRKVYAYFFRKTNSEEDAKDLLQTTFLRLWQYRESLNAEYSLDQQLFYIGRNVFIDYIRKANKQDELKVVVNHKLESDSLENYQSMAFDTKDRIQKILSSMPAMRKKVFEMHKIEGYSYKEIAQILSISEKSVDNHLSKSIKQLRKLFIFTLLLASYLYRFIHF